MTGGLHHLELWVADLDAALPPWGWLLEDGAGFEVELVADVTAGSATA
jgi:hypothetical protein